MHVLALVPPRPQRNAYRFLWWGDDAEVYLRNTIMTAEIIQFIPRTRTRTLQETEELKAMEFLRHAPALIASESELNEAIWLELWRDNLA
jgi:hypothetical protein